MPEDNGTNYVSASTLGENIGQVVELKMPRDNCPSKIDSVMGIVVERPDTNFIYLGHVLTQMHSDEPDGNLADFLLGYKSLRAINNNTQITIKEVGAVTPAEYLEFIMIDYLFQNDKNHPLLLQYDKNHPETPKDKPEILFSVDQTVIKELIKNK